MGPGIGRAYKLLMCSAEDPRRQNRFWLGAELVLEVVCPDKSERDLIEKQGDYAEARIPEYWIINPQKRLLPYYAWKVPPMSSTVRSNNYP
jgi:Uma2 family endonuclease